MLVKEANNVIFKLPSAAAAMAKSSAYCLVSDGLDTDLPL